MVEPVELPHVVTDLDGDECRVRVAAGRRGAETVLFGGAILNPTDARLYCLAGLAAADAAEAENQRRGVTDQ